MKVIKVIDIINLCANDTKINIYLWCNGYILVAKNDENNIPKIYNDCDVDFISCNGG